MKSKGASLTNCQLLDIQMTIYRWGQNGGMKS
jgi:hypothetical protein